MSLKPQPPRAIPPEIAAWGAKHLSDGDLYKLVGDTLYPQYRDEDFADCYHPEGKPALSPALLALVTVFQRREDLADRAASNAVRTRLDWKYALHLPLDDDGFDPSVLCEFRQRLLTHAAEARLFEQVLAQCTALGLFKRRGTQRTDSTHVLAAVRALNRIELVGEAVRVALNVLAVANPAWLQMQVEPEWQQRYGAPFAEWHLPQAQAERDALLLQIGRDGQQLLQAVDALIAPPHVRELPEVETLRQIWVQQYYIQDQQLRWRKPDNLPPATLAINSPHDAEARYSSKRSTIWVGYKVHLSESCDDDAPRLITNVELTPAPVADTDMTATIHQHLAEHERLPDTHLMDAGYIDAEHLVRSRCDYQVEIVGPVPLDPSWQARAGKGFDAGSFRLDWDREVAFCPMGKRSRRWKEEHDSNGNPTIHIEFAAADCRDCAVRADCTQSTRRGRQLNIRRRETQQALKAARERQTTAAFKEQYAQRAGMEGTLSLGVRMGGLRRSRYIGEAKTWLQELFIAIGLNLARVAAWLAGERPVVRRTSAFVKLMASGSAA
jgi:transposase